MFYGRKGPTCRGEIVWWEGGKLKKREKFPEERGSELRGYSVLKV